MTDVKMYADMGILPGGDGVVRGRCVSVRACECLGEAVASRLLETHHRALPSPSPRFSRMRNA